MTHDRKPQVLEVRRSDFCATVMWDRPPTKADREWAERTLTLGRDRVGHCWPGDDEGHAQGAWAATKAQSR